MTVTYDSDVVVVGYGPTGLAATSLLACLGHRGVVLERHPGLYGLPRLVNLDAEAARIVQAAGNVDEALKDSTEFEMYYFKNGAGKVLLELDWSGRHHVGFASHLSMYQPHVEDAMDAGAKEHGADVRQGWQVTDLEQDDDGVNVHARSQSGETTRIRTKWLIAADGANSTIRDLVGAERVDLGMRSAFLNLDTRRKPGMPAGKLTSPVVTTAPPRMQLVAMPPSLAARRHPFRRTRSSRTASCTAETAPWTRWRGSSDHRAWFGWTASSAERTISPAGASA